MKSAKVIIKNLKLLIRSKGSALMVLLAPLLVVIIVGVGFTDTTDTKISIGIYNPDAGELSQRFIENLNSSGHEITLFTEEQRCVQGIREGIILSCITFPENFTIEGDAHNELIFYVDESRLNLVHQLTGSLTQSIDTERTEVTQELTAQLLDIVGTASIETEQSIARTIALKAATKAAETKAQQARGNLGEMDLSDVNVNFGEVTQQINAVTNDYIVLRERAELALTAGYSLITALENDGENYTQANTLKQRLNDLNTTLSANHTDESIDELKEKVSAASAGVSDLRARLDEGRSKKASIESNIDGLLSDLSGLEEGIDSIKERQERISSEIASFTITSPELIASPIQTRLESVTTDNRRITFSFPYLLMLVILFVGIMLSSALVFMEKESKAYFRNFTTPAKKSFFMAMTYLTSVIVIAIQTAIILLVVHFALSVPINENLSATLIVILLGMTVFILIGMFLGHLFNTFEAITMSTIAIGSTLLFISNLVLPIETLSPAIQEIARHNPYVITSESIRKTMLFNATIDSIQTELLVLLWYTLIIILGIKAVQKITTGKYFARMHHKRNKTIITVPEDHYLVIEEKNITIKSMPDLIEALKKLTDKEYKDLIAHENIFSTWLRQNLKARILAIRIKSAKREAAIKLLEKYVKKRKYRES